MSRRLMGYAILLTCQTKPIPADGESESKGLYPKSHLRGAVPGAGGRNPGPLYSSIWFRVALSLAIGVHVLVSAHKFVKRL